MRIHAIQTGTVKMKTAQAEGLGRGFRRQLAIFTDPHWTAWLPIYAWAIEHPEGVIVVDTGAVMRVLEHVHSWHPFFRWEAAFRLTPEQEVGAQLRALGIGPRDVKKVMLTHMHVDHDGGLAHFPNSEILVAAGELRAASGWAGRMRGYLPQRWPAWFDPTPLHFTAEPVGPFARSRRLTLAGDVVAVSTPGHTANHVCVLVHDGNTTYLLAGDASYSEAAMLAGTVDGVSPDENIAGATLRTIRNFARSRPTVYLPSHDPQAADRLKNRQCVEVAGRAETWAA